MNCEYVLTTCPYCGCGCQFYLEVLDDKLSGVLPCKTHPVSEGKLCIKGWNAYQFVQNEKRLTNPLIKRNGKFDEVSWDEAIQYIADKLKTIKESSGPDSIAFLASAKCTNEENYLMMKLARSVIGTNNIDHCARL